MLLSLQMPQMGDAMLRGTVVRVYLTAGSAIRPGAKLLDVRVDLDLAAAMDCPPIYFFRIVAGESGWVREVQVTSGAVREVGAALALFSTTPEEALSPGPARTLRVSQAAILDEPAWPM